MHARIMKKRGRYFGGVEVPTEVPTETPVGVKAEGEVQFRD